MKKLQPRVERYAMLNKNSGGLLAQPNRPKHKSNEKLNSILLGLFLSSTLITKIITTFVALENTIVIVIGLLLLISFLNNRSFHLSGLFLTITALVAVVMIFSVISNADGSSTIVNYLLNFFLFGAAGFLLYSDNAEPKTIYHTIVTVFLFFTFLTVFKYIPEALEGYYVEYSMDVSYAMLIGVSAVIFVWESSKTSFKILISLATAVSMYYLLFLSDCRGAVAAIAFLVAVKFFSVAKHKILWALLFVSVGLFVLFGWDSILEWIVGRDTEMRWLIRFQRGSSDISSGRTYLYAKAIQLIKSNPFSGNGVAAFESMQNNQYTHNLFLQFMVEYGVIFGLALSVYIVVSIVRCLKSDKTSMFDMFLVCQFIPRLLISSVYWSNPFFWLFLYKKLKTRKKKSDKKS